MCALVTNHMTERVVINHVPEVLSLGSLLQIEFHGVAYIVTTVVQEGQHLTVEVEQQSEASRWRGQFTAQCMEHFCKASLTLCRCIKCTLEAQLYCSADIEDISAKTGNYKKFAVFVRMLASAIRQESDSVFVDLLTYSDLETLKNKKAAGRAPLQRTIPPNNKRYLILTYAAEFDRVHYPLPLLYEEPTVEHLQTLVQQLRAQSEQSAGTSSKAKHGDSVAEVRRLRDENAVLQRQLAETEQQACTTSCSGDEQLHIDLEESKQEVVLVSGSLGLDACNIERSQLAGKVCAALLT